MSTSSVWRNLYPAAMLELDRTKLMSRIEAAQAAIRQAMEELTNNPRPEAVEEARALADALHNLQTLRRVEFRTSTPSTCQDHSAAGGLQ